MGILFFETESWEEDYLRSKLGVIAAQVFFTHEKLNSDHSFENRSVEAISVFVGSQVDKTVLDQFPELKFLTTRSTGYDHIDLEECHRRNIIVATVPTYGENTVAEHAFGLLLSLSHKIYEGFNRIRETGTFSCEGLQGFDLKGKTLGVVGTGHIGRHVIRMAKGFEMEVIAYDPKPDQQYAAEAGFHYVSFSDLLSLSDVLTIHVPYIQATHHLINKGNIYTMKKGAVLINTSRGPIVETEALVEALTKGHLGGAGLDVLEEEGAARDERAFALYGHPSEAALKTALQNHVLFDLPNVIITPHNAFNTREALQRILDTTIENIKAFQSGMPKNTV